jgi:hypothetical protein
MSCRLAGNGLWLAIGLWSVPVQLYADLYASRESQTAALWFYMAAERGHVGAQRPA